MMNFRKAFHRKQNLHTWHEFAHGAINLLYINEPVDKLIAARKEGLEKKHTGFFESKISHRYMNAYDDIFCEDDDPRNMDRILARLIKEVVDTVP